ncbi:MAG: serine hydrolase [Eubacteriales bacterium]|nr:serine hydrolase [Eubacteriales bacterium]
MTPAPNNAKSARYGRDTQAARAAQNRAMRLKRKKRKRRRLILLLILILVLLGAAITGIIYLFNGRSFDKIVTPYKARNEFSNELAFDDESRLNMFATNLCVVSGDVPLESATLEADQTGLLFDLSSNTPMYAKGVYQRIYPASITKIMTAMLVFEYGNLDEVVTITEEDVNLEEGSQVCGFIPGDSLTLNQLVHCLLVYSGNDAAAAIARYIGGSVSGFVDKMNSEAAKLGCTGTHFTNPHGLSDTNHYTTPYDIYLMLKEALKYPSFTEITQLSSYTVEYKHQDNSEMKTVLTATDHYLTGEATPPTGVTILGGKTGTLDMAGNCLALLSQDQYGKPFISIVMGAKTKDVLYEQMNSLLQNINQSA